MVVPLAFFLADQIIFIIIFSAVGLFAARKHSRTLSREINTEDSSLDAYLRFASARSRVAYPVHWNNRIWTIVLICMYLPSLASSYLPFPISDLLDYFFQMNILYPLVLTVVIGYIIGSSVYSFSRAMLCEARAVHVYQISSLLPHEFAMVKLRQVLLQNLPLVLYLEAIAILLAFNPSRDWYYVLALLIILCSCGAVLLNAVFEAPLYALKYKVEPIAKTQWAALVPRIAAWAQLGQVEFSSIQVQQDIEGISCVAVVGLGKPTLVLGEFFLRHSEWRQQDALIGFAVGVIKTRAVLHEHLGKLATWGIIGASVLLFLFMSFLPSNISSLSGFVIWVGIFVAFDVVRRYRGRVEEREMTEIHRIASFLTGDPTAVRVAMSVNYALNGTAIKNILQDGQMQKLDELAQESWSQSPQAGLPVPTVEPFSFGSLTIPLDQATAPAPVPAAPYRSLT